MGITRENHPSDVVGYTTDTSIQNNNFKTVAFATVGYNTSDIQQIKLDDGDQGGIGWGEETFAVWTGVPTVVDGSSYTYFDSSYDPEQKATSCYWGDDAGNKASFSIAAGQGVVISCNEGLSVATSGEVPSEAVTFTTIQNNNFTGNPFPAEIDIQAISLDDDGAGSIGWGEETFAVWEGVPTVRDGSSFTYFDSSYDPTGKATSCYWGDDTGAKAAYTIAAGQGVVISCNEGLTLKIKPPYSL